jgi:hypothetical protein
MLDFVSFLKNNEGKSGKIIFDSELDKHVPSDLTPKYDKYNPDVRNKFLEHCYNS